MIFVIGLLVVAVPFGVELLFMRERARRAAEAERLENERARRK